MIHGTREDQLAYMRSYYKAHQARLHAASVERVKAFRARKARQHDVVAKWLKVMRQFDVASQSEDLRAE